MIIYSYECPRCLEWHRRTEGVQLASGVWQILCPSCDYVEWIKPARVIA